MAETLLKNRRVTSDPRLDRVVQFDEESRQYPIRTLLPDRPRRSYTWRGYRILDQGREGACVGFGWAHELIARPRAVPGITDRVAREIYVEARKVDEWPGESYEGTSVIAGAKVVTTQGHMTEYRWAFGYDDVLDALGYYGPVVLGLNWYTGMMNTDADGFIVPTGHVEGGHCVLADSISVKNRRIGGPNSWGTDWGQEGRWSMTFDDLERLLEEDGEACIAVGRKKVE